MGHQVPSGTNGLKRRSVGLTLIKTDKVTDKDKSAIFSNGLELQNVLVCLRKREEYIFDLCIRTDRVFHRNSSTVYLEAWSLY